jgi:hypothetical protein
VLEENISGGRSTSLEAEEDPIPQNELLDLKKYLIPSILFMETIPSYHSPSIDKA